MEIIAFAANSPNGQLNRFIYQKELGDFEVLVSIKYCSITNGDVKFIDNYWNDTKYPMVPGSEIFGIISNIGNKVGNFKIGDFVGIGFQVYSCSSCEYCLAGLEQFCLNQKNLQVNEYGGAANKIIVHHRHVFHIPDAFQNENFVPLMCSGLSTYSSIRTACINQNMKIGVIGIGNLGHIAIQILNKIGCDVSAFSSDINKKETALNLGTRYFYSNFNSFGIFANNKKYDFLLSTSSQNNDYSTFIELLKPTGKLCILGVTKNNMSISSLSISDRSSKVISGSYLGSRSDLKELFHFFAINEIKPIVEIFPFNNINEVIARIKNNHIRFSAVLTNTVT